MNTDLKIKLVHYHTPELGRAWEHVFQFESNIEVIAGNIFEVESDAIVSPGNSFGFMDGGLDLMISKKYGWGVQTELKRRIALRPLKELLVGQAETIELANENTIIICAPTMRVPTNESIPESVNAYMAMKAILHECISHKEIKSVAITGLCTGTGGMDPKVCANQMGIAYFEVIRGNEPEFPTYMDAKRYHMKLKSKSTGAL